MAYDYGQYRTLEIGSALVKYNDEMESIHVKRLDIARQEMEAWKELKQVIMADNPSKLSNHFTARTGL